MSGSYPPIDQRLKESNIHLRQARALPPLLSAGFVITKASEPKANYAGAAAAPEIHKSTEGARGKMPQHRVFERVVHDTIKAQEERKAKKAAAYEAVQAAERAKNAVREAEAAAAKAKKEAKDAAHKKYLDDTYKARRARGEV